MIITIGSLCFGEWKCEEHKLWRRATTLKIFDAGLNYAGFTQGVVLGKEDLSWIPIFGPGDTWFLYATYYSYANGDPYFPIGEQGRAMQHMDTFLEKMGRLVTFL